MHSSTRQPSQWPTQAPPPRKPGMSGAAWFVLFLCVGLVVVTAGIAAFVTVARARFPAAPVDPAARATTNAAAVPTPDAGQRVAYLAALEGIDRGLVVNEDRAIRRGRSICDHILHPGGSGYTLREYVVLELSGGNATIDQAQAAKVIAAVKVWCRP